MKLPDNLVAKLNEPLPPEAIKPHPSKPYLSSINSIYVTERLNNVFGIGGWKLKVDVLDQSEKMVTVKVCFTVPEYGIELEQFGGNDNADKGDALKGATTDALTKIGSYLGIGAHVWKDKKKSSVDPNTGEIKETPKPRTPSGLKMADGNFLCSWTSKAGKPYYAIKSKDGEVVKWLDGARHEEYRDLIISNAPKAPVEELPF